MTCLQLVPSTIMHFKTKILYETGKSIFGNFPFKFVCISLIHTIIIQQIKSNKVIRMVEKYFMLLSSNGDRRICNQYDFKDKYLIITLSLKLYQFCVYFCQTPRTLDEFMTSLTEESLSICSFVRQLQGAQFEMRQINR